MWWTKVMPLSFRLSVNRKPENTLKPPTDSLWAAARAASVSTPTSGSGVGISGGGGVADRPQAPASSGHSREITSDRRIGRNIVCESARIERKIDPVRLVPDRKGQPHGGRRRRGDRPTGADPALA